jgi:general secretion pathway protein K
MTRFPFIATAHQRGTALLSALLMVIVLSMVLMATMDDLRLTTKRLANARAYDQAAWHAKGVEDLARRVINRSWKAQPSRATLNDPWAVAGATFPVDNGSISSRIRDGGNCFNLNSVVQRDARGRWVARPMGIAGLENLFTALGIVDAEPLTAALVDWIDSDLATLPSGAEDSAYMGLEVPYRTAGTLLGDATELRTIRGYNEKIYRVLRPFVCAQPTETPSVINVNTLTPDMAPLLIMTVGQGLSLAAAVRAIEGRPLSGYGSIDEFWAQPEMVAFKPDADAPRQLGVTTRYFALDTRVVFDGAEIQSAALIELSDNGETALRQRRLGLFE